MIALGLGCDSSSTSAGDVEIQFYRLQAPGNTHDIEQASGLHCGKLGDRRGLWVVCDRNGGRSAGRVYFISTKTLERAKHERKLIADEVFPLVPPAEGWPSLATAHPNAPKEVLAEIQRRVGPSAGRGPMLDLEAVTIAPSPTPPHGLRVFVVAEEPFSTVLELALEGTGKDAKARIAALYVYEEAEDEHGTDRNDGLEGLAYAGRPGEFFWVEEGTRFHDGPPGPRLFFLEPKLGLARLQAGQVQIDRPASNVLTAAVRTQRKGKMQTLNALAICPDGRLLAIDRNGGWILRVEPEKRTAARWLDLYNLAGTNLRDALADFPGARHMPYISIEGLAVDEAGTLWLVDDPALPEGFRASCLVRIEGLNLGPAD